MNKITHLLLLSTLSLLLSACGGGGSDDPPPPPVNIAPIANAGTDIFTFSAQAVVLNGSTSTDSDGSISSYVWTQTSGNSVSLTNQNTVQASFMAPTVTVDTTLVFQLQITDNDGASNSDTVSVLVTAEERTDITITGKATYDNVPHSAGNGLNYNGITQDPIRGAVVELITGTTVSQSGVTDLMGNYAFDVVPNSGDYFIRIKSHALLDATAKWDAKVVDNTQSQALYALDGSVFSVAVADITRPTMNAGSGWGGTSYTGTRAAGAFHILDRVMDGHLKLQSTDASVNFPPVDINWSPNNSGTSSDTSSNANYLASLRAGNIGTSFFTSFPDTGFAEFAGSQMFILGAANSDTDEYDGHVVVHEWGHYFENNLSRSDSIGGAHAGGDRLDMRVAFGEGFGNAWSGIITDDAFYRDSSGASQANGFNVNVELNAVSNPGWFSEGSVQSILYDVYDSTNDGSDTLSLGIGPIYEVLTGQQKTTEAFTSIFSFIHYLKANNPAAVTGIDAIVNGQIINGTDIWGIGETNAAGAVPTTNVLPVYTELVVGGPAQQVCSVDDYDSTGPTANSGNKLSNFRFVRFNIATAGNYSFLVSAGATQDPDVEISQNGRAVGFAAPGGDGAAGTVADSTFAYTPGTHVAVAYEFDNTFNSSDVATNSGDECFTIQIQAAP